MHTLITPNPVVTVKQCTFCREEERMQCVFDVNPISNIVSISCNEYYDGDVDTVSTETTTLSSIVDYGDDCKVTIKDISDFGRTHSELRTVVIESPKPEKKQFKRIKNENIASSPIQV